MNNLYGFLLMSFMIESTLNVPIITFSVMPGLHIEAGRQRERKEEWDRLNRAVAAYSKVVRRRNHGVLKA